MGLTLLSRQLQQWVHHQRQLQPALAALLDETRCAPGVPGTDGAATPPGGTHSSAILAATHEEVARILQPTWAHLSALLGTIREVHDLLSADPQGQEQWEHSLREAGLTHLIALALEHETPPPR